MVVPIEVDRFGLVDALQNACRLAEAQANDRGAIAEATAKIVEEWIFSVTRDAKDVPIGRKLPPRR